MTTQPKISVHPIARFFFKLDWALQKVEEFILANGIIVLAIIMVVGVISRVGGHSLAWTEEISKAIVVLLTFLGLGYCTRKARHIRMSALHDVLPAKIRKILIIIVSLVTAVILVLMAYWAVQYTMKVHRSGSLTSTLRIPMCLIYMWVPVGLLMAALEYILTIYKNIVSPEVYLSIEVIDGYEPELIGLVCGDDDERGQDGPGDRPAIGCAVK